MKLLVINGPARSGKNMAATMLGLQFFEMSRYLKEFTHRAHDIDCAWDAYSETKDRASEDFGGRTPRQAYVQMYTGYLAPMFGEDVLARWMAEGLEERGLPLAAAECGKQCELAPLVRAYGRENILVLRIYPGSPRSNFVKVEGNFDGDCREYIDASQLRVDSVDVLNHKRGLEQFRLDLLAATRPFFR